MRYDSSTHVIVLVGVTDAVSSTILGKSTICAGRIPHDDDDAAGTQKGAEMGLASPSHNRDLQDP